VIAVPRPTRAPRLVPTYSDATMRMFELFFAHWRRRRLHTRILDVPPRMPDGAPLILVANHTSWWDGFLLRDIQRRVRPGCALYSVMTARELARNPFLRRIGAVPLDQHSPASLLALLRALRSEARARAGICVSWFPQGRIGPSWQRPLGFRPGIELLVRALQPCWLLPVGIHFEPLNRTLPTAFVSAGVPVRVTAGVQASCVEAAVHERLDRIVDTVLHLDADYDNTEERR
jgi:1-acyl-sn-glycerol-3-phosphate acyltransferase